MSRHFHWLYSQPLSDDAVRRFDACFAEQAVSVKHMPFGGYAIRRPGTDDMEVHIILWANKAKARRLSVILDARFGAHGSMEILPDYSEGATVNVHSKCGVSGLSVSRP